MKKHFVVFYSPGTLISETTEKEINSWNIKQAVKMSFDIKERHNSTPYGFRFITKGRTDKELDSKIIKKSGVYYLGGKVYTLKEIKDRDDPDDRILISNMEFNGYNVIENNNSWKTTVPFYKEDILLNMNDYKEQK